MLDKGGYEWETEILGDVHKCFMTHLRPLKVTVWDISYQMWPYPENEGHGARDVDVVFEYTFGVIIGGG